MTQHRPTTTGPIAPIAALPAVAPVLALLALAQFALVSTAQAQDTGSVQDFRLPPATATPTSSAAGPVDAEHPSAAPTRPAPIAPPSTTISPAPPPIVVPPPPVTTASPAREPAAAPARAAPRAEAQPETQPTPAAVPTSAPVPAATFAAPAPTAPAVPPAAEPAPRLSRSPALWPWIAGGGVVVLLLGALLLRRRRIPPATEYEPADIAPERAAPEPSPPAALTPPSDLNPVAPPAPAAQPAPAPESAASPAAAPARPLEMQLEARHLSRALVNATLAYRLTLTNHAAGATGPLRIAGDIVSAHASLPPEAQLAPGDVALATIHEVPPLAPGESVSLSGELRLPIASILPIHSGAARVFVPLARFRAEDAEGPAAVRVFVIGQASEQPGGALRPFPLDRGPGVDRALGQRELALPA